MQGRFNENMNKEINELDRMTVGVREWAVDSIWTKGMGLDRWLVGAGKIPDTKIVLEEAAKLEEYVLRGIKD